MLKKMRQMEKKLNSVEEKLDLLLERMEARGVAEPPGTKKEDDEPFQVATMHILFLYYNILHAYAEFKILVLQS